MEMLFNQFDVIDGICVGVATREQIHTEGIDVDLTFHPDFGIGASVRIPHRPLPERLGEQDIKDSIAVYLRDYHNFHPDHLIIDLTYLEPTKTFGASIKVG